MAQYLKNRKETEMLQEQNKAFLEDIQQEAIDNCPFQVGDAIKGEERANGKIRAMCIRNLKASIKDDGTFQIVAQGYPMNLDGTHKLGINHTTRRVYINEKTEKLS